MVLFFNSMYLNLLLNLATLVKFIRTDSTFLHSVNGFYYLNKLNLNTTLHFVKLNNDFGNFSTQNKENNQSQNSNNRTSHVHESSNWPVLGLSLFSVFGLFGNVLVCLTIRRDQSLQTKTNFYLFSLAMADLAVCVIVLPFSIIQDFYNEWVFDLVTCTFWIFADILLCTSSIYHLSVVAVLRFIAIQYPLKSSQSTSKQLTGLIIILIWSVSILISSGILYLGYVDQSNIIDEDINRCMLRNNQFIIYGSIFSFVIPLFIMIIMFGLMARKLRKKLKTLSSSTTASIMAQYKQSSMLIKSNESNPSNTENNMLLLRNESELFVTSENMPPEQESNSNKCSTNEKCVPSDVQIEMKKRHENGNCNVKKDSVLNNKTTNSSHLRNLSKYNASCEGEGLRRHVSRQIFKKSRVNSSLETYSKPSGFRRKLLKKRQSSRLSTLTGHTDSLSSQTRTRQNDFKSSIITQRSHTEVKNELKALQVLGIVFIAFIIAWLPYCFVNMLLAIFELHNISSTQFQQYLIYLTYLGYFQSTFNPIIYTVFNRKFRRNFIEIVRCRSRRQIRKYTHSYRDNFTTSIK